MNGILLTLELGVLYVCASLYLFLPAFVANAVPVIATKLKFPFGVPISSPLFGKNKSWRGLIFGIASAVVTVRIQKEIGTISFHDFSLNLINYSKYSSFVLGFTLGGGALLGDLVESTIKRRRGYPSGYKWQPWDQVDYIVGALFCTYPFVWQEIEALTYLTMFVVLVMVVVPITNIANKCAYKIGIKQVPH